MKRYTLIVALIALALSTLACSFSGMNLGRDNATFTITLQEKDLNELIEHSNNNIDDEDVLLKNVTRVDLQEGLLTVYGAYEKADGSEAEGNYDLTVGAENGELQIQITGVNIEGVELGDRRIQRMNEAMERELSRTSEKSNGEVEFESATITNDSLTIVVKTHFNQEP